MFISFFCRRQPTQQLLFQVSLSHVFSNQLVQHISSFLHHPKLFQYSSRWSHTIPYGPIQFLIVPYSPLWSRTVLYGPVQSFMVPYSPLWSHTVPYCPVQFLTVPYSPLGPNSPLGPIQSLTVPYTPLQSNILHHQGVSIFQKNQKIIKHNPGNYQVLLRDFKTIFIFWIQQV